MNNADIPVFTSYASADGMAPIDIHASKEPITSSGIALSSSITGVNGYRLDVERWLPLAAPEYDISPDPKDYVFVPVPVIISEIPNVNGDSMSKEELLRFQYSHGCPSYATFRGKPTFIEHQENTTPRKSSGIIFDSIISKLSGFRGDHAKVTLLLGFDRNSSTGAADAILRRLVNTYSMGVNFRAYTCVKSGKTYYPGQPAGPHTQPNLPTYLDRDGNLIYRKLLGLEGFECSVVINPAFFNAISDEILTLR